MHCRYTYGEGYRRGVGKGGGVVTLCCLIVCCMKVDADVVLPEKAGLLTCVLGCTHHFKVPGHLCLVALDSFLKSFGNRLDTPDNVCIGDKVLEPRLW